jgi:hypothetical protein
VSDHTCCGAKYKHINQLNLMPPEEEHGFDEHKLNAIGVHT